MNKKIRTFRASHEVETQLDLLKSKGVNISKFINDTIETQFFNMNKSVQSIKLYNTLMKLENLVSDEIKQHLISNGVKYMLYYKNKFSYAYPNVDIDLYLSFIEYLRCNNV